MATAPWAIAAAGAASAGAAASGAAGSGGAAAGGAGAGRRLDGLNRRCGDLGGRRRSRQRALEPLEPLGERVAGRVDVGAGRAKQRQLDGHPRLVPLANRRDRVGEDVDRADERDLAEPSGLIGEPALVLGDEEEVIGDLAEGADHEQLAEVGDQIGRESRRVTAAAGKGGDDLQRGAPVLGRDRVGGAEEQLGIGDAEHCEHVVGRDLVAAVGDELIEGPERVAEAAVGGAGDRPHRPVGEGDRLRAGHPAQDDRDVLRRGAGEVEALAAIDDRRHHLVGLGGRQHENGVRRRLLERLQERVPGLAGEHVRLVEDVDLPLAGRRRVADPLAQLADVVDGAVRGGVHLDHVHR